VKEKVKNALTGVMSEQLKEKSSLDAALPIVKTLCMQISNTIDRNLPSISDENDPPEWWKNLASLARAVANQPNQMIQRKCEIEGFLRGIDIALSQIEVEKHNEDREERAESKVQEVAEKIKTGEVDPNKRRKVGERPESLKTLRLAQAKLSEDDN